MATELGVGGSLAGKVMIIFNHAMIALSQDN